MCGGINAISEHLPWSQSILLPFYEMIGKKKRLSKAGKESLHQNWDALLQALTDVKHLVVPESGAPLTLRVDAAESGIGAVLLALIRHWSKRT